MAVSRTSRVILDSSRRDPCNGDEIREIVISIYSPMENHNENGLSPYSDLFAPASMEAWQMLASMGADLDHLNQLRTNIHNTEKRDFSNGTFPVVLYAPAFGVVKEMYAYNIEAMVELGFIVIAVGATHESIFTVFPDGRLIKQSQRLSQLESEDFNGWNALKETRIDDLLVVLDWLEAFQATDPLLLGILDLNSIGIIGHSLGGAAAFEVAKRKSNVKAVVMLDASFHLLLFEEGGQLETPFLVMRQGKTTFEELRGEMPAKLLSSFLLGHERLYDCLSGYKSFMRVAGTHHMSFCDVPLHYNEAEAVKHHTTINRHVGSFLQLVLLGKDYSEGYEPDTVAIDATGNPLSFPAGMD